MKLLQAGKATLNRLPYLSPTAAVYQIPHGSPLKRKGTKPFHSLESCFNCNFAVSLDESSTPICALMGRLFPGRRWIRESTVALKPYLAGCGVQLAERIAATLQLKASRNRPPIEPPSKSQRHNYDQGNKSRIENCFMRPILPRMKNPGSAVEALAGECNEATRSQVVLKHTPKLGQRRKNCTTAG
jgi:hypothetical protein